MHGSRIPFLPISKGKVWSKWTSWVYVLVSDTHPKTNIDTKRSFWVSMLVFRECICSCSWARIPLAQAMCSGWQRIGNSGCNEEKWGRGTEGKREVPGSPSNPFKMDGNGDFQPFPIVKIWFIITLKQPFIHGCRRKQRKQMQMEGNLKVSKWMLGRVDEAFSFGKLGLFSGLFNRCLVVGSVV